MKKFVSIFTDLWFKIINLYCIVLNAWAFVSIPLIQNPGIFWLLHNYLAISQSQLLKAYISLLGGNGGSRRKDSIIEEAANPEEKVDSCPKEPTPTSSDFAQR